MIGAINFMMSFCSRTSLLPPTPLSTCARLILDRAYKQTMSEGMQANVIRK
jgi:hypothetical protein